MAEPTTAARVRESFANGAEIDEFVRVLEQFERGEISAETWRKYRLVRGTYGQRQDDAHMLRVKIPQGVLDTSQLNALADVARDYSRGFAHVTTRQNVQFHFMRLHDVEPAMRRLADAGVTTREACGNSVRNITACPMAGVSPTELFDVTPYAEALTRYFLRHPLSACLPRKFKIAFEGCEEDHALTAINDLGWTARVEEREGRAVRGFRLTAGGGTSILPTSGGLLFAFLPAAEMLMAAEAVVRVFHRLGDFEHKHRNRLKFLIKKLGWDCWRDEVMTEFERARAEGSARLPFDPNEPPVESAPAWPRPAAPPVDAVRALAGMRPIAAGVEIRASAVGKAAYNAWRETNLVQQRQAGYVTAIVTLPLGDVSVGQLRVLSGLAAAYGDGTVRLTTSQNMCLRWVPENAAPELFARLEAAELGVAGAQTVADVTSCPGAESCKLAVTQSRGLGRALIGALADRPDLVADAASASIKISGCPNGCGQHHIATIGFQGSVRKLGDRAVPQYFVMVGGSSTVAGATFARLAAKVPARRVSTALERLLDLYRRQREPGETPEAFFARLDVKDVRTLLADLASLTVDEAVSSDFVDLGEQSAFVPEVMDGECAT
jgi:sulfite reductase (NADPH) hemoprotein beta-component